MDCPSLNHLGYGDFSERLHSKVSLGRYPLNGSLEVTARCNLRCQHCYLPMSQRAGSRLGELSLLEIRRIFSEIADAGCLWLLLTGGEPFMRKDFLEIYDDAKQKGFIITLFTNGTLLTEQIVDHLAEWRPFSIEISIYGATQATYERVTGIPGSFTRCMRGIEMLLERNLPLKLKSVLITVNQHELAKMKAFSEGFGLEFRFDPVINAGIDGSLHPTQYRLSPEQIVSIEKQDPDRSKRWPEAYEKVKDIRIDTRKMFNCGAGRSAFHIDASGKLSLCIIARSPNYDLRRGNFQDGWDRFIGSQLTMEHNPEYGCFGCELRTVCAQCPALSFCESGDLESKVSFLCELSHLRWEAFTSPIIQ